MKTKNQQDIIEVTLAWLIFAVTLFLGSLLLIPFIQGKVVIQEQSEIFTASLLFLVDSLVFFPPLGSSKVLKYLLIGLNLVIFS